MQATHALTSAHPTPVLSAGPHTGTNYALEKHASKERHKAFMCTCTIKFPRLATLNSHIAAQAGPRHYCIYCDDDKAFAPEDKLIDHLRGSHKFGEQAVAQSRS